MAFKDLFVRATGGGETNNMEDISSILKSLPSQSKNEGVVDLVEPIDGTESIGELYKRLGTVEMNKIYDVLPFIDSLPSSMDIVSKKAALIKILQAAKYNIDELKANADSCISAIENANNSSIESSNCKNKNRQEQIQLKLLEIETLESEITKEDKQRAQQESAYKEEIAKLKTIKGYIE